jgi:hypothetical protein
MNLQDELGEVERWGTALGFTFTVVLTVGDERTMPMTLTELGGWLKLMYETVERDLTEAADKTGDADDDTEEDANETEEDHNEARDYGDAYDDSNPGGFVYDDDVTPDR